MQSVQGGLRIDFDRTANSYRSDREFFGSLTTVAANAVCPSGTVIAPVRDSERAAELCVTQTAFVDLCLTLASLVVRWVHLRHDDPCCLLGRHGGRGSEWRTRLGRFGLPGFRVSSYIGGR